MLRRTFAQYTSGSAQLFEFFCREQLCTNRSLREMSQRERRKVMSQHFRNLPKEDLLALTQKACFEQMRQEALERAVASFKPLTVYDFFIQEQKGNPALLNASPREREVQLLHIFNTLPEKARKALKIRTEEYNISNSKRPTAYVPLLTPGCRKQSSPTSTSSSGKKKRKTQKKGKGAQIKVAKDNTNQQTAGESTDERPKPIMKTAKAMRPSRSPPYSVFVQEQMPSLHHLQPKERMRVIGERWRSLTNEERQRRLEAGKAKLEANQTTCPQKNDQVLSSMPPVTDFPLSEPVNTRATALSNATDGTVTHISSAATTFTAGLSSLKPEMQNCSSTFALPSSGEAAAGPRSAPFNF